MQHDLEDLINQLSDDGSLTELEEIVDRIDGIGDKIFLPSEGPQMEAYFSEADIVLFGGSPGGGKTALEVGLGLNDHHRTLVVRRQFSDLDAPIHTLENILNDAGLGTKGLVGGQRPKYNKPDGGVINFMGMGDDFSGKQGLPHDLICVGKGTLVLMHDGSYQPVESVNVGDYVMTLEGKRKVLRSFSTPKQAAVRVTANGFSQVQSASHKLLTGSEWACLGSKISAHPFGTCVSIQSHECDKFYEWFLKKCQLLFALHAHLLEGLGQLIVSNLIALELVRRDWLVYGACTGQQDRDNACVGCYDSYQKILRQPLLRESTPELMQQLRDLGDVSRNILHYVSACDDFDGQKRSLFLNLMGDYLKDFHLYDERTRESLGQYAEPGGDQSYPLRLVDAGQHNPSDSLGDDGDIAPKYTCHTWLYDHPYKKGVRQSSLANQIVPCSVVPVYDQVLYDLEIEGVNHFITHGGFINKNCIDEAAQFPEHQIRMLIGWLRTDKKGQRCRVVMGSNPPLNSIVTGK